MSEQELIIWKKRKRTQKREPWPSQKRPGSGHSWPLCMCPQEDTWSFLIHVFLKPEEDPEREKELCQRSTSQRNWKKEWNWQFIRLKIKPVWRAPLPTLQGSTGPGEGREGVQCVIWLHQLAHFTDKETELQTGWAPAKSLGCQGGQGKFQPMLFCLQG